MQRIGSKDVSSKDQRILGLYFIPVFFLEILKSQNP